VLSTLLFHVIVGVWCKLLLLLFSRCSSWTPIPFMMPLFLCYSFALLFLLRYSSCCYSHVAPLTLFPSCCSSHIIPLMLLLTMLLFLHYSFCTAAPFSLLLDSCITIFLVLLFSPYHSSHTTAPLTLLLPLHYYYGIVVPFVFQVPTSPTIVANFFCLVSIVFPLPLPCASQNLEIWHQLKH
jgi:hypothetical protein